MSAELQWGLIRNYNAFMVRRSGVTFSREAGNLLNKHSFKYSGLAQPKVIRITAVPTGVAVTRRSTKKAANKIASTFPVASIIKKSATSGVRAQKVARDLQATGYRLDLIPAAQAKVSALLRSHKARKTHTKKLRANKLAKLTKNN